MNLRVTSKIILQHILSNIPKGTDINFFFQTVKKGGLRVHFLEKVLNAGKHLDKYLEYTELKNPFDGKIYELGAGRNLTISLTFFGFGINYQIVTDIRKLIRANLLNDTLNKFKEKKDEVERMGKIKRQPGQYLMSFTDGREIQQLHEYFGIHYIAPIDTGNTRFESESFDFIFSTVTLEHIPLHVLKAIFKECRRILKHNGIMSHIIDLRDHFSCFDGRVSPYNFLTYPDFSWKFLNPWLHYQNRLRHKDYIDLAIKSGFSILEDNFEVPAVEDINCLKRLRIHHDFQTYPMEELAIKQVHLVLRKE